MQTPTCTTIVGNVPRSQLVTLTIRQTTPRAILQHAVSNKRIVSVLYAEMESVEITREYLENDYLYFGRILSLPKNEILQPDIAEDLFNKLKNKYHLTDKTPAQIMTSCNQSSKASK